jgi:hypothetical protein
MNSIAAYKKEEASELKECGLLAASLSPNDPALAIWLRNLESIGVPYLAIDKLHRNQLIVGQRSTINA